MGGWLGVGGGAGDRALRVLFAGAGQNTVITSPRTDRQAGLRSSGVQDFFVDQNGFGLGRGFMESVSLGVVA